MLRAVVAVLFLLQIVPASAQDSVNRKELLAGIKKGFAESIVASNAPNWLELVESRFPADLEKFLDRVIAAKGDLKAVGGGVVQMVVEIQSRDGNHLTRAPQSSLKSVLEAQRSLIKAAEQANPEFCVFMVTASEGIPAPSLEVARWTTTRLFALLNAIADGRDKPVFPRSPAADADYEAFAQDAMDRGFDVASWSVLSPEEVKSVAPSKICAALAASLDAMLTTKGEAGERIQMDAVIELLTVDEAAYKKAIQ